MTDQARVEEALGDMAGKLAALGRGFALVDGLAVSVRAEVRFTRDVDLAVAVADDTDAEQLIFDLQARSYRLVGTVEQDAVARLATARLVGPHGIVVDLMFASCGIEREIVERATPLEVPGIGAISVARAEELLAMKVLSMDDERLQDRIDARNLIAFNDELSVDTVRENLALIAARGFGRGEPLRDKLDELLRRP